MAKAQLSVSTVLGSLPCGYVKTDDKMTSKRGWVFIVVGGEGDYK